MISPAERVAATAVVLVMFEAGGTFLGGAPLVLASIYCLLLVVGHGLRGSRRSPAGGRIPRCRLDDPAHLDAIGVCLAVILCGGLHPPVLGMMEPPPVPADWGR